MFYHIFSTSVINIVPFTPHIELGPPSQIIIQYSHHSFQFVQKALCHWQISPLKNWPVATNLRLLGIVGMEWNIIQAIKSNIGNFLASSFIIKKNFAEKKDCAWKLIQHICAVLFTQDIFPSLEGKSRLPMQ